MTVPTLKVEVALASDPLDLTPTYTDLTAHVKQAAGVTISRGRDSEFTSDSSGSATFTLLNDTRRFDPLYSAGPYYGTLTPGRAVRISDSVSGEVLFTGFVVGWPQSFESGGVGGLCVVRCTDALGYLSGAKCNNDPYYDYLADTVGSLDAYYGQTDAATWMDSEDPVRTVTRQSGASTVVASLAPGLRTSAIQCAATAYSGALTAGTTFSFWVQTITKGSSATVWQLIAGAIDRASSFGAVGINNAGRVCLEGTDGNPGVYTSLVGSTDITDGRPHHICIVNRDGAGMAWIYVDGSVDAATIGSFGGIAGGAWLGGDPAHDRFTGTMQAASFSDVAMTAAQVQTLYGLGLGFQEESSVTRLTRLADDAGWPATWRDFTTNPHATVGAINYAGQAITEAAQEVERSEQGRLFASKTGVLTFHGRYAVQETTRCNTTQATLSDDPAAGKAYYRTFGYRIDDRDVQNDITVRTPTGEGHAEDATSIATYGRQSTTIDTVLATPTAAQQMADGLLYQRKDVQTRTPPIEIPLGVCDATAQADLLGLELNDRISVEITPQGIGSQVVLPQQVERIEWTITADEWLMRISGSPVKPTFFMLGTSTLGTDRLGY